MADDSVIIQNEDAESQVFSLYAAKVLEVYQKVGTRENDKRLTCRIQLSIGGIFENVPFYGGGVDLDTGFPHGLYVPPRKNQLVGILFLHGQFNNPIACFPIPYPSWTLSDYDSEKYYNNILDSVNDIVLFHYSGTRVSLKEDGKIRLSKKISQDILNLTFEFVNGTEKKKIIYDEDNDNKIELNKDGIKVQDKNNNIITLDDTGIKLEDLNGNTIEMISGEVKVNGTNLEVLQ